MDDIGKAFLAKDFKYFRAAEDSSTEEGEGIRAQHRVIRYCLELAVAEQPSTSYAEYRKILRQVLETPPSSISERYILLLCLQVDCALEEKHPDEANRYFSYLKQFDASSFSNEIQILVLCVEWRIQLQFRNYSKELSILERAFKLVGKEGSLAWLRIKSHEIEAAILHEDFQRAVRALSELEMFRNVMPWQGVGPYEYLQAWFYLYNGESERGLAILKDFPVQKMQGRQLVLLRLKIELSIYAGRLDEARQALDAIRDQVCETTLENLCFGRFMTTLHYEGLRTLEALASRDFDRARTHAKITSTLAPQVPRWFSRGIRLHALSIELASKQVRAARVFLQTLDPDQQTLLAEWMRLFVLEKNEAEALKTAQKMIKQASPASIRRRLGFAFELSPGEFGFLVLKSQERTESSNAKQSVKVTQREEASSALIGESPAISEIREKIAKYAPLQSSVLISGETGSGKEVVARLLHQQSPRAKEPFIAVNCAAIGESLIMSELFGHVRGAFSGATSDRQGLFKAVGEGTLFLDEITSTSPAFQASLLRVLEENEIRPVGSDKTVKIKARIIAATNDLLDEAVAKNLFRKDLFFRLSQLHVFIPPLRERKEDIPSLARFFLKQSYGDMEIGISDNFFEALKLRPWPGNVRELRNEMERIACTAGSDQLLTDESISTRNDMVPGPRPITSPRISQLFEEQGSNIYSLSYRERRREKLRNLFKQYARLSRADIVKLLNCSPNTATEDLRVLERENWIRRVSTSAHLRTSYFVLNKQSS
jgi:DNA-binding NtrC family response regulator